MNEYKSLSVPIDSHIKLHDNSESGELLSDANLYRIIIGKMLYLTSSMPDIAFAVQHLSKFLHAPRSKHLEAVSRVLRYLQLTKDHGLFFPSQNNLQLKGYSDSDWGGCAISRRYVGGYAFFLGNVVVSWRSKIQHVVSS
ncbi:hypothetical protein AgCh_011273 [Apium graveolens]